MGSAKDAKRMNPTINEAWQTQLPPAAARLTAVSARSEGEPVRSHPSLFQINTRVLLTSLSRERGRPATLDDMPDELMDRIAENGFDVVWFLGVWQTGSAGQKICLGMTEILRTSELVVSIWTCPRGATTCSKSIEKLGGYDAQA